jgi:galactose mutarotase-like enzyme
MSDESHAFGTGDARACVLAHGAELCWLRDAAGIDYLWDAGAAWPRHAPVLFPIIGRLRDDTLRHEGQAYRVTQHGFARDRRFTWVERTATGCVLALEDDDATRALYPFPFRLEVRYAIEGSTLTVAYVLSNTGNGALPASLGAHPAFRWPLAAGVAKEEYSLTFEAAEPEGIRSVSGGLLTDIVRPSPLVGQRLDLSESLFADDALIWENVASRWVRFSAARGPGLTVAWQGFPQLGVWMKLGSDFLCIEPWAGLASPAWFDGEFMDKPYGFVVAPGATRESSYSVTVEPG